MKKAQSFKYSKNLERDSKPTMSFRHTVILTPGHEVAKIYDATGRLVATMDPVTRERTPVDG